MGLIDGGGFCRSGPEWVCHVKKCSVHIVSGFSWGEYVS